MSNKAYESQKRTLNYSKSRVQKAGRDIRHGCDGEVRRESIEIIQNFREVHLYPLMLIKNHLIRSARKVSRKALVARRLKRLPTIINKLERATLDGLNSNAISLSRMQDIGGCRAILANIQQVKKLHSVLQQSNSVHKIIKTHNYLTPKDSGYGGIHLIYSCYDQVVENNEWKKIKIEVQLRTELQHAWATSLEIIDTLEGINLKTSLGGYERWRRFYKIAGLLVAHEEKACEIDELDISSLVQELSSLEAELEVRKKLFQYRIAISFTIDDKNAPKSVKNHQGMFLFTLFTPETTDNDESPILKAQVISFRAQELDLAFKQLAKNEADNNVMISVMVSANDARSLKKAYPNYFGSTDRFEKFLSKYIGENSYKSIDKPLTERHKNQH